MRSVTRKKVRMALERRVEVVKQVTPARLLGIKENPPEVVRRKIAMMKVMEGMKRKPVSRSFRRPLTPCALTEVHLCTPLTASSSGGREKSMPWSQRQILGSRSSGPARPSSLMRRITLTAPPR